MAVQQPKGTLAIANARERCCCGTCATSMPGACSIVLAPQADVEAWAAEVFALPARKRSAWKARLVDECGVVSRVRYTAKGNRRGPWCSHFEEYNRRQSTWLPVFAYEAARQTFATLDFTGTLGQSTDVAMQSGEFEAMRTMFAARGVGKGRSRKKYVTIPTAPGEPTRG